MGVIGNPEVEARLRAALGDDEAAYSRAERRWQRADEDGRARMHELVMTRSNDEVAAEFGAVRDDDGQAGDEQATEAPNGG
jgi:hypothetical protein